MLGHHMCAGATTSFCGDQDLEAGSEADGSHDGTVTSGDDERDESKVPDKWESVGTVKFYAVSIAKVPNRSVRVRLSHEQKQPIRTSP